MKSKTIKRQISKTSIIFPHLVPINLFDNYVQKSLPWRAVIASVEVRFTQLTDDEYDALYEACMQELYPSDYKPPRDPYARDPYALDLDLPKLGMKGGAK